MTRYVIIGAGAIGGTTAAELHRAGRDVLLVARGEHGRLIAERGLDYRTPDGAELVPVPVVGGPDEVELRSDDILVVAVKAHDTESALAGWAYRRVIGADAPAAAVLPVLLLQNGLDGARSARRRFSTVVDAAVMSPATYITAGQVVSPAAPKIAAAVLGAAGRAGGVGSGVVETIADDLRAARYLIRLVDDIAAWKAG